MGSDENVTWLWPGESGDDRDKDRLRRTLNIAVLSEGYLASERHRFERAAREFAGFSRDCNAGPAGSGPGLYCSQPFHSWRGMFTIVSLFKASAQSWADLQELPATEARPARDTAFKAFFDSKNNLAGDNERVQLVLNEVRDKTGVNSNFLPIVLINNQHNDRKSTVSGTSWVATCPGWVDSAVHEVGHLFGLGDEYDNTHAAGDAVFEGTEPANFANLTLADSREGLKALWDVWRDNEGRSRKPSLLAWYLMMSPGVVVRNESGTAGLSVPPLRPGVPLGTIGLFEGGDRCARGIFRPTYTCRMRSNRGPFCRVCTWWIEQRLGRYLLRLQPGGSGMQPLNTILYTNVAAMANPANLADHRLALLYHTGFGTYVVYDYSKPNLAGLPPPNPGVLDKGLRWLKSFQVGGKSYVFAHSFGGQDVMYRLESVATGQFRLLREWDSGTALADWSHGAVFEYAGRPHIIQYNWNTGDVRISRIDGVGVALVPVYPGSDAANQRWRAGWTIVQTFGIHGEPHVLLHDGLSGDTVIQSLTPPGTGPNAWVAPKHFWNRGATAIQPFKFDRWTFLLRTTLHSRLASIERVRDTGGVDNVGVVTVGWEPRLLETVQRDDAEHKAVILNCSALEGRIEHIEVAAPSNEHPGGAHLDL